VVGYSAGTRYAKNKKGAVKRSLSYFKTTKFISMKYSYKILITIFLLIILKACAPAPRFTSDKVTGWGIEENLESYNNNIILETVTGTASYYSDQFHQRITYSGEVYNMNNISAAHPTYPMNTIIRITNLDNNKSTILRINDKMPFHPERIIDVSLGTAKKLDFVKEGLINVKIEVLQWGDGRL